MTRDAVVLLSGGLDSAAAFAETIASRSVLPVFVDYEQAAVDAEVYAARAIADLYNEPLTVFRLPGFGVHCPSALSGEGDVTTPAVVLPARNAMLLSLALTVAGQVGADRVVLGVTRSDADLFPDCRVDFLMAYGRMASYALNRPFTVEAPFIHHTKAETAACAVALGVPIYLTHSCYTGQTNGCGVCIACQERIAALVSTEFTDAVRAASRKG